MYSAQCTWYSGTLYTYCSTFAHFSTRHCFAHWTYTEGNVLYLYLYLLQHLHYFRSSGQMASSLHWRVSYTHIPPLQPSGRSGKTFNSCPVNRDQIDYCYYYSTRLALKLSKINLCLNNFWKLSFYDFDVFGASFPRLPFPSLVVLIFRRLSSIWLLPDHKCTAIHSHMKVSHSWLYETGYPAIWHGGHRLPLNPHFTQWLLGFIYRASRDPQRATTVNPFTIRMHHFISSFQSSIL